MKMVNEWNRFKSDEARAEITQLQEKEKEEVNHLFFVSQVLLDGLHEETCRWQQSSTCDVVLGTDLLGE